MTGMRKCWMGAVLLLLVFSLFSLSHNSSVQAEGVSYPPPPGGYTCLPTCAENDGQFLSMPGEQMASFGGERIVVWIGVADGSSSFELGIFDGDAGKDNQGNLNWWEGNWDSTTTETTYTLLADPLKDGAGNIVLGVWHGNGDPMPNNDWFNIDVNTGPEARAPSGHYFYRLEISRPVNGFGINALKLRSTGFLSTGKADLVDANFAIVGMLATLNDIPILYPEFDGDWNDLGESTYSGDWQFHFYLPFESPILELWDGDFDRGSWNNVGNDTDDPNTVGKPPWASESAVDEHAVGQGAPADDYIGTLNRREPAVWYEINNPASGAAYVNDNPSGSEEWEWFSVSTDPADNPDIQIEDSLQPGWYGVNIFGLDLHNTVWIRINYEIAYEPPPPVWPEGPACPRTIGYWKNNVKKVLIQGKPAQETRESLEAALNNAALWSPLFRSGIDVSAPAPIDTAVRLSDQEAHDILRKAAGNTMLDRALQQNLATWLNLGSGKIHPDLVISLDLPSGRFEGTIWEALQEAQNIIFNERDDPARLERAKDIADYINNRWMEGVELCSE